MDTSTVLITVSVMMLANSGVLAVIYRDLPTSLRLAAIHWQIGTLLITMGCAILAFGSSLPVPLIATTANGLFLMGLANYHWSLARFHARRLRPFDCALDVLLTVTVIFCVFWFSAVRPNVEARLLTALPVWLWLMFACVLILADKSHRDGSLSRKMLSVLFMTVMVFTLARAIFYVQLHVPPEFSIVDNASWMNPVSPMFMTVLPVIGTTAFILMCSDHIRRQWEHAASSDYLTGLANRRTLAQAGDQRLGLAAKQNGAFAVAVVDVDAFKAINDTYGHDAGDQALIHVATRLQAKMRTADLVARSGGEEFVAILSGLSQGEAKAAAERLRLSVQSKPFKIENKPVPVTVSVGLAVYQSADKSFEEILRRADMALYRAKSLGRNRVELAG